MPTAGLEPQPSDQVIFFDVCPCVGSRRSDAYWAQVDDILAERGGLTPSQFEYHLKHDVIRTQAKAVARELHAAARQWSAAMSEKPARAPFIFIGPFSGDPSPGWMKAYASEYWARKEWEARAQVERRWQIEHQDPSPWCARCAGPVHRAEWVPIEDGPLAEVKWAKWQLCGGCRKS